MCVCVCVHLLAIGTAVMLMVCGTFPYVRLSVHVDAHGEHHVLRAVAVHGQLAVLLVRPHVGEQHAGVHVGRVGRQLLRLLAG